LARFEFDSQLLIEILDIQMREPEFF